MMSDWHNDDGGGSHVVDHHTGEEEDKNEGEYLSPRHCMKYE